MLDVEDWAEIRRLSRAEGLSIKEITRRLGVSPASGMGPPSGEFRQQHGTTSPPVMGPPLSIHQRRRR